jgi:hypothetical protein
MDPAVGDGLGSADLYTAAMALYNVASIDAFNNVYNIENATTEISHTYDDSTNILTYRTNAALSPGYYVLVTSYLPEGVNYIKITFQTDSYACPFSSAYPDVHANFQGCSGSEAVDLTTDPINTYPCLKFSTAS